MYLKIRLFRICYTIFFQLFAYTLSDIIECWLLGLQLLPNWNRYKNVLWPIKRKEL